MSEEKNWLKNSSLEVPEQKDKVHPGYYDMGEIDLAVITEKKLSREEFKGFCKGMFLKYLLRADDNAKLEDYRKAQTYLNWLISKEVDIGGTYNDKRTSPAHYEVGGLNVIDVIVDKLTFEEFKGFVKGIVLKYVTRAEMKNGLEDYVKASYYLDKLINVYKKVIQNDKQDKDV